MAGLLGVRDHIRRQVLGLVGAPPGEASIDLDAPAGDPGLFGPDSASWCVHADFTAMMVGGVAALLLQMLHPAALAGVWDHSNFRQDATGRLRRTAQFIAGTTFGGEAEALRLIARVRSIHRRVTGSLPNGTTYAADDPALLTWVHVAEVSSFLAAHLRYRDSNFPGALQDRYFAETATIAKRLGATDVPVTRRTVAEYLRAARPMLAVDERTHEVRRALLRPASPTMTGPARTAMIDAGIDLLPRWAAAMHGIDLSPARRRLARVGVRATGASIRWALTDGSAKHAARRVAAGGHALPQ